MDFPIMAHVFFRLSGESPGTDTKHVPSRAVVLTVLSNPCTTVIEISPSSSHLTHPIIKDLLHSVYLNSAYSL